MNGKHVWLHMALAGGYIKQARTSNRPLIILKSKESLAIFLHFSNFNIIRPVIVVCMIKTHGSESRGQEEAGLCDEPVSYLQVAPL